MPPVQLKLPKLKSEVEGFFLAAEIGKKAGMPYHSNVAHNNFIKLTIVASGQNPFYPGRGESDFYLYFVYPEDACIYTYVDESDNAFYISVPADDEILDVLIVITHDDQEFAGVNLVLMSRQMDTEPYYSILIVPDASPMQ